MSRSEITISAIPNEITPEGQNYVNAVLHFGKYAPQPPPDIIRLDEAGPNWERPSNEGPVAIFRRAPTYELNDYSGGFGVYMRDANSKPIPDNIIRAADKSGLGNEIERSFSKRYGATRPTIILTDIIQNNKRAITMWAYTYFLQSRQMSLYSGTRYLIQISNNDAEYPSELLTIIKSTIDQLQNRSSDNIIMTIVQKCSQLRLYIPRNLILPEIQPSQTEELKELAPVEEFLFGNIYWLRYFRPERPRLNPIINNFGMVDLYLIAANPFERYSARKLLSYYPDQDLYFKFGRLGNFFFPKTYPSKRVQLDGIVGMCLQPFGYFTIENWTRPVRLTYHRPRPQIPFGPEDTWTLDLDTLINANFKLDNVPIDTIMPFLRLALQIESSWPLITDKYAWQPFLDYVNSNAKEFYTEYQRVSRIPITNVSVHTSVILPDNFESLEQKYTVCLLCEQVRPPGDFSLCGHGTCVTCQAFLGTAKCPFCTEHFIADNISDDFVRILQSNPNEETRIIIREKVKQVTNLKRDRPFKFDWANGQVRLFTG